MKLQTLETRTRRTTSAECMPEAVHIPWQPACGAIQLSATRGVLGMASEKRCDLWVLTKYLFVELNLHSHEL